MSTDDTCVYKTLGTNVIYSPISPPSTFDILFCEYWDLLLEEKYFNNILHKDERVY